MKVVTVNVPESYVEAIEKLTGDDGLYPSRSELIRVAVREWLIKELKHLKKTKRYEKRLKDVKENEVRIPMDKKKNEFKTYKIVKKLG